MQLFQKELHKCLQTQIACKHEYSRLARLKKKTVGHQNCVITSACTAYGTKLREKFQNFITYIA